MAAEARVANLQRPQIKWVAGFAMVANRYFLMHYVVVGNGAHVQTTNP
jgi:hypothetical protein